MIRFPQTLDEAAAMSGERRAGGTDVQARAQGRAAPVPLVDLQRVPGLDQIEVLPDGRTAIGSMVRIAALAESAQVRQRYPGLAAAADQVANPQIRALATLGGNLLQRTRCWYYRHPAATCYKKGGDGCPARAGNHLWGVCFDLGPCVAPHPSTLGMALLAYDARVERHNRPSLAISDVYGPGTRPSADHQLDPGDLLTRVILPAPQGGERATYARVTGRAAADWPLVEVLVRAVAQPQVSFVRAAAGGVAPVPLRLGALEDLLVGRLPDAELIGRAVQAALEPARPLAATRYKLALLDACLADALAQVLQQPQPAEELVAVRGGPASSRHW